MAGKTESIQIQRSVSLYKQPLSQGRGSPNWYARVYMPIDGKRLHVKSTGTTDKKLAELFALEFYGDCLVRSRTLDGTLPVSQISKLSNTACFDKIADKFLDQLKTEAGDDARRLRNWKDHFGTIHAPNGFGAFFKSQNVNDITTDDIRKYLQFALTKSRKGVLAAASQKRSLSTLSQLLKFAYEKRLLNNLPLLPRIKTKDNPRPKFEKKEYQKLWKTAFGLRDGAKDGGEEAAYLKWAELGDFIVFMVGSFLRPSEWAALTNAHIKMVDNDEKYLEIRVQHGKTGDRRAITMGTAVDVYKRILRRNGNDPQTYLFKANYENRQTAKERMADDFADLLKITGLGFDAFGKRRPLYSLRHTSLMLRMTEGNVKILHLAQNAGTSIEMLQRFYLKNLNLSHSVRDIQSFMEPSSKASKSPSKAAASS